MRLHEIALLLLLFGSPAVALLLRRGVDRPAPWQWFLLELVPVVVTWIASWSGMWLYASLAWFAPNATFGPLALASACIPALPVVLAPPRYRARVAGAVLMGLALLLFADTIYFRFFGGVLPLLAIGSAGHLWDVRDSIVELLLWRDVWYLAYVIIGSSLLALWPLGPSAQRPSRPLSAASAVLLTAACLLGAMPVKVDVERYIANSRSWKVIHAMSNLKYGGVLVTHARDVAVAWREAGMEKDISDADRQTVQRYVDAHAEEVRGWQERPSFGALAGTNVVMLQMEAIQQWAIDVDVRGEPVMPFLRSLKSRSLYFSNVYDQTGGSPTSDCEYLVLNGLHPLARGAVAFRRPDNDFVAVPELFATRGYRTVSAHAYLPGMWNRGILHPRYGFQRSLFKRDFPEGTNLGWGIGDKVFLEHVADLLEEEQQPFFAFLITLTSHHPYNYVPAEEYSLDVRGLPRKLAGYLRSARYVDEAVAQLFARLAKAGLADNTTVILYGDHDAKLKLAKKTVATAAKHLNLDEASLRRIGKRGWSADRVPLFVVPPTGADITPGEVSTVGGQLDIGPTLLHYFGIEAPRSFLGAPLLEAREGWTTRFDGAAAEAGVLLHPGKRRDRCSEVPGTESDAKPSCSALKAKAEAQVEVSALITGFDLAAGLAH